MTPPRRYDSGTDGPLISAYLDGELDPGQRVLVEHWLQHDARARRELEQLRELEVFTGHLQLAEPPPESWERFGERVLHRGERRFGWVLMLLGLVVVAGYVLLRLGALLITAALPLLVRLGVLAVAVGLLVLLGSVVRERFFTRKRDRYDDVVR